MMSLPLSSNRAQPRRNAPAAAGAALAGGARRALLGYWPLIALFVIWQTWVVVQSLSAIVMPSPAAVLQDLGSAPGVYLYHGGITLATAVAGLVGGTLLGSGLAVAAWTSRIASGLLTPVTVMFSSVPVVALIPIIARLLGYDVSTVIAVAVIITFFPSFVFVSAGLRASPPGSEDLLSVLGASRFAQLRHLALPAAMPSFAIALRIAAAQAILAAMVAEFLMGTSGLGYLFNVTLAEFDTERAFGASLVATLLSLAAFLAASRLERWVKARFT